MAVAPSHYDDAPQLVELLYERHGAALRAFCTQRLRRRDEAEEAVQATFLRALKAIRSGVRPHSERAWLLTIARNVCVTRATAAHRRHEVELDSELLERNPAADAPELGVEPELAAALAALPEGQRRAFVLRAVHGLSYREIASELGVGTAAVESWIFRARRSLAAKLPARRFAFDLPSLFAGVKSLLPAGVAAKLALAATVAATAVAVEQLGEQALQAPAERSSSSTAAASVSPANARPARLVRRNADAKQRRAPTVTSRAEPGSSSSEADHPAASSDPTREHPEPGSQAPAAPAASPPEPSPQSSQTSQTEPSVEAPLGGEPPPAAPQLPVALDPPVEAPPLPVAVPPPPLQAPSLPPVPAVEAPVALPAVPALPALP